MSDTASLEEVNVLKARLERYIAEYEEVKILRILHKLASRRISMDCLKETGIGRIVSKLKKQDGEIGSQANELIEGWKNAVKSVQFTKDNVARQKSSHHSMRESALSFVPTASPPSSSSSRSKRRSPSPGSSQSSSSAKRTHHQDHMSTYNILATLPDPLEDEMLRGYLSQPLNVAAGSSGSYSQDSKAAAVINSTRRADTRIKMFAGKSKVARTATQVPRLMELCIKVLMDNINLIEDMGPVPYHVIKPVLVQCSPVQLKRIESYNQHLIEDSDELWQEHCEKQFKITELEDGYDEYTFRDTYERKVLEREQKLKSLTANINRNTQARAAPVRQTKLAFVDSKLLTKGPRIPRSAIEPIGIKAKLKQMNVPPAPRARGGWGSGASSASAVSRPGASKSGPLMQKSMKAFKSQMKR